MSLKLVCSINAADKHDYDVTSLVYVNGKLYSASDDGKIKIWSPDLKLLHQIQAHPCSIYSIATDGKNIIYTCSNDGTVKSWSLDKLEERGTILTSEREFWKLYWDNNTLYIVNDQGTIFVYKNGVICGQIETLEQIKDIAAINKSVFTVRDLDLNILEQYGDKSLTMTCATLSGRAPLCISKDKLAFSDREGHGIFVHFNNKEKHFKQIAEIKNIHDKLINALAAFTDGDLTYVYSAGWDNVVNQWIINDDGYKKGANCLLPTYVNVICLDEKGEKIFTAGGDGNIWRLDYS